MSTEQTADLYLHGKGAKGRRSMVFFRGNERIGQIFGDFDDIQILRGEWIAGATFGAVQEMAKKLGLSV